ncbi:unnamed protein product [Clonostachys rosea f. rosea IK726]|uniref:Uncharacterized protein n=1 Tax=Clonostachys rosea f. rosea IK726 TaxID=1349383 RepID=A0ACA9T618_BIOOC|nr:unnamed protein product [Clonostachys rosea f. rosea IK726]
MVLTCDALDQGCVGFGKAACWHLLPSKLLACIPGFGELIHGHVSAVGLLQIEGHGPLVQDPDPTKWQIIAVFIDPRDGGWDG